MESLHERRAPVNVESTDFDLMEVTDEEIEVRAVRLIRRLHNEKIKELDQEIIAFSQS